MLFEVFLAKKLDKIVLKCYICYKILRMEKLNDYFTKTKRD